jgi:hypothetical protein
MKFGRNQPHSQPIDRVAHLGTRESTGEGARCEIPDPKTRNTKSRYHNLDVEVGLDRCRAVAASSGPSCFPGVSEQGKWVRGRARRWLVQTRLEEAFN